MVTRGGALDGCDVEAGSLALKRQPSVLYGADIRNDLGRVIRQGGWTRVLPVVTSSLVGSGYVAGAIGAISPSVLQPFTRLRAHTPFDVVLDLSAEIRDKHADAVVVIGGGSAIDAVKIATLAASVGVKDQSGLLAMRAIPDATGVQQPSPGERAGIAIIAVPTTLSGAEFGLIGGATQTNVGIKHLYRSDTLAPDIVIFDPALSIETPIDLWLTTGIRSIDHAVETILSRDANPFTNALAFDALAFLRQGLCAARQNPANVPARHKGQLGNWLAAAGIGRVRYGASHGIGHQLGAVAGVPHGVTSCVLLPAVLAYNAAVTPGRQKAIASAFGRTDVSAAEAVRDFISSLGLPVRISELQVDRRDLIRIAETSIDNAFVRANLRPITTVEDVQEILETAW